MPESLGGGFICVNDFHTAKVLTLEALPLVFDNDKLEAEIKGQLDHIASEQEKTAKSAPRSAPSTNAQRPANPAGGDKKGAAPRPEREWPSLFHNLVAPRIRLPLIVAVGIALLIAIPFFIQVVTGPNGIHPSQISLWGGLERPLNRRLAEIRNLSPSRFQPGARGNTRPTTQ